MAKTDATGKVDEDAWVFASPVSIKAGGFIGSLANDLVILILLFFPTCIVRMPLAAIMAHLILLLCISEKDFSL